MDDERFNLTPDQFIKRYHIHVYIQDAIRQILDNRDDKPLEGLLNYFNSVLVGDHVLLREFEFVNATPRNRLAFVRMTVEAYQNTSEDKLMTCNDHFQLVSLLCPDFPTQHHDDATKLLREASGNTQNLFPYKKIAAYWQILFVFSEFIAQVKDQFPPSTLQLDRNSLMWSIKSIINSKHWDFSCPSVSLMDSIVSSATDGSNQFVTFNKLMAGMASCTALIIDSSTLAPRTKS